MKLFYLIGVIAPLISPGLVLAKPSWTKDTLKKIGTDKYLIVCSGEGPAVDLARNSALQSCKSTVLDFLSADGVSTKAVVETENSTAYFSETKTKQVFRNLTCEPKSEAVEVEDGYYEVWLKCLFDLTKASIESINEDRGEPDSRAPKTSFSSQKEVSVAGNSRGTSSTENKVVNFSVIPGCSRLIISGQKPRTINCKENPVSVALEPGDKEITVIRDKYRSKTIKIDEYDWGERESIQVLLQSH